MSPAGDAELLIAARAALLDALDALAEQRQARVRLLDVPRPLGHERPFHGLNHRKPSETTGRGLLAWSAEPLQIAGPNNTYKYL
jgi:hypothetical protein